MTPSRYPPVLVGVIGIVLLAGCTYPSTSDHDIDFDGTVERSDGTFQMLGQVEVDPGTAPDRNFGDVRIVLYDDNQTVILEEQLGPMSTDSSIHPSRRAVNITSDVLPTYVIIESPDLWEGNLPVDAFRWEDDGYTRYPINSEAEKFG